MRSTVLAALLLLSASVSGQDSSTLGPQLESRMNEHMASARLIAAERRPSVTSKQCTADMASWDDRDDADDKAKVQAPNYWFEKLSTEELMRLSRESTACSAHYSGPQSTKFLNYSGVLEIELFNRAEAILRNHGLIHELLLETSH